jgi:hypothetical protein
LPRNFVWTKADNSTSIADLIQLEAEFGYRFIETVGSLNFLSNTVIRQLFAIRKTCRHMQMPGRKHYEAIHHLLHHLRCYPARPLIYYRDATKSPLAQLLKDAGYSNIDPSFVYFTDSSHGDCDDGRSTGCYIGLLQGGLIDMSSSVPLPVAQSAAEAETAYASITCMATAQTRRTLMAIEFGDEDRPFSVPIFTDSQATIDIARNDRGTSRTRHMARRQLFVRSFVRNGSALLLHIGGKRFQVADIGTKGDIVPDEFEYKLSIVEAPSSFDGAITASLLASSNRRGVLDDDSNPVTESVTSPLVTSATKCVSLQTRCGESTSDPTATVGVTIDKEDSPKWQGQQTRLRPKCNAHLDDGRVRHVTDESQGAFDGTMLAGNESDERTLVRHESNGDAQMNPPPMDSDS